MSETENTKNTKYSPLVGMKVLWRIMAGQRLRYGAAVMAILLSVGLMFIRPIIVGFAIDYIIGGKTPKVPSWVMDMVESAGGRSVLSKNLWIAALAMVITMTLSGLFNFLRGRWAAQASETIVLKLKNRLYDKLQHLPLSYFDKQETGDLVQRCTSDVETVRVFLAAQAVEIGRCIILVLLAVPILCYMDVKMALASLYLMPVVVIFTTIFFVKIQPAFKATSEAEGAMTARLQENLNGIRVVRAFARGDYECERFAEANDKYRIKWFNMMKLFSVFWPISDYLCAIQSMSMTIYGAWAVAQGELRVPHLTIGQYISIITVANMFIWPLKQMGQFLAEAGKSVVSLGRIGEILDAEVEPAPQSPQKLTEPVKAEIKIRNLSFGFDGETVLHDISLDIPPASTLAIVGPSGSGKSLLINLLLRLYDYDQGEIFYDGVEIRSLDRKLLRQNISAVLQEPFLYSRSIRDNISLAKPGCDQTDMISATIAASVHENIEKFDDGYDTLVGEKGVTLSGGQRQRVTIARALLKDSPVLVLDDSLSAVDTETESKILNALEKRRGRQTTIIIAHRLSTLTHADNIIVLEHGRITQQGTHDELIVTDGLYKRLWDIQTSTANEHGAGQ